MSVASAPQVVKTATIQPGVIVSTSPATGRQLGEVATTPPDEVKAAVRRAREAQAGWYDLGMERRTAILRDVRKALYRNVDLLIDLIVAEQGRPKFEAISEFWASIEQVAFYTRIARRTLAPRRVFIPLIPHHVHRVEYRPYGVVAVIAPWNFPLILSIAPIAAALIAGNTVVYKPSEFATQVGNALAATLHEAGVPRDVFQIVQGAGEVGAALVDGRPDKIVFTGSAPTARKIAVAASQALIPLTLELGGKDAAIVLEDADLDRAAAGLSWASLLNAGQACLSVERIYVRREIAEQFVQKLAQVIDREVRVGPGESDQTTMGAITTPAQLKIIDGQVREAVDKGAQAVTCGKVMDSRSEHSYPPTILTNVTADMRILSEETFGPVIPVITVENDEEALRLANETAFGLTGSVWTRNTQRGLALARRMRVGHASVNDHVLSASAPNIPWGGIGESGYGRTRGREGLLDMAQTQVISGHRGLTIPREIFWYPYTPFKQNLLWRIMKFLYADGWRERLRALLP